MTDDAFRRLTRRERECLRGVAALKSSDIIAGDLGIAPGTVNSYIKTAIEKLGARDRRHAAQLYSAHERDTPEKIGAQNLGVAEPPPDPPLIEPADDIGLRLRFQDAAVDSWRMDREVRERSALGLLVRQVLDGTRPDEMTMMTRAVLTLAAAMVIGFCFFALSAGAGLLFGIADVLRWLAQ